MYPDMTFEECNPQHASFHLHLAPARLAGCPAINVNFIETRLPADFSGSDLSGSQFERCNLCIE